MIQRLFPYFLLLCFLGIGAVILSPTICWAPGNASRATCQANLKQIGLALRQYWQDNDEQLPPRRWATSLTDYTKGNWVFQCPETSATTGTSDYFFNAHFLKGKWATSKIPRYGFFWGRDKTTRRSIRLSHNCLPLGAKTRNLLCGAIWTALIMALLTGM